jgi:hypothetical protein
VALLLRWASGYAYQMVLHATQASQRATLIAPDHAHFMAVAHKYSWQNLTLPAFEINLISGPVIFLMAYSKQKYHQYSSNKNNMKKQVTSSLSGKQLSRTEMKRLAGGIAAVAGKWSCSSAIYSCYANKPLCTAVCFKPFSCRQIDACL